MENDLDFETREHEDRIEQIIERQTETMTDRIQETAKRSKTCHDKNEKLLADLSKNLNKIDIDFRKKDQR